MTSGTKTAKDRVYITPVIKGKRRNFLNFLRSLKIEKEDVTISSNGDFYIFNIDLSKKSDSTFGKIRNILNKKQTSFFK